MLRGFTHQGRQEAHHLEIAGTVHPLQVEVNRERGAEVGGYGRRRVQGAGMKLIGLADSGRTQIRPIRNVQVVVAGPSP